MIEVLGVKLLDMEELRKIRGVTSNSPVYDWISKNKIHSVNHKKKRYVPEQVVKAYYAGQENI